jgi:Asp-tRNA(Asn)/Glu-tRNA(Gln) amidotransferase A subunit family amidase
VGFAIGSETFGSIVGPCVINGVTGLRSTFGRIPRTGAVPLSWTMDKIGPLCRGVEDCAMVLWALHGADGKDLAAADVPFSWNPALDVKSLRVGVDWDALATVRGKNGQRHASYAAAVDGLGDLGVDLRPLKLPEGQEIFGRVASMVMAAEGACSFSEIMFSGEMSTSSWPVSLRVGATIPAADYLRALRVCSKVQRLLAQSMADLDVYVTVPSTGNTLNYTNIAGYPSLLTRCGMEQGRPVMMELIGSPYQEAAMLRLGLAYEQVTQWNRAWPEMV